MLDLQMPEVNAPSNRGRRCRLAERGTLDRQRISFMDRRSA